MKDREKIKGGELERWIMTAIVSMLFVIMLLCFGCEGASVPVETIAFEASSCSQLEQEYVAGVIKQRVKERGLSADSVCMQKMQFSCWNKGVKLKKRTKGEIEKASKAWRNGRAEGYNHYALRGCDPYWAKSAKDVYDNGEFKHIFYRL